MRTAHRSVHGFVAHVLDAHLTGHGTGWGPIHGDGAVAARTERTDRSPQAVGPAGTDQGAERHVARSSSDRVGTSWGPARRVAILQDDSRFVLLPHSYLVLRWCLAATRGGRHARGLTDGLSVRQPAAGAYRAAAR